jgi:hypothetical protein
VDEGVIVGDGELVGCGTRVTKADALVEVEDKLDPSLLLRGKCFRFLADEGVVRQERMMRSRLEPKSIVNAENLDGFILEDKRRSKTRDSK